MNGKRWDSVEERTYEEEAFGQRARRLSEQGEKVVYRIDCDTGMGIITDYRLFPGISLQFNEICGSALPEQPCKAPLLELNYCEKGQYECEFSRGGCACLREGGFAASSQNERKIRSHFPLETYVGISVLIDVSRAQRFVSVHYPELSLCLDALPERLCPEHTCLSLPDHNRIREIFRQIYDVPAAVEAPAYYRVKVLELLLLLTSIRPCPSACVHYLKGDRKALMEQIRLRLQQTLDEELPLRGVAETYGICLSVLRRDFTRLYGLGPGAYRRRCRMQAAARMLVGTDLPVTDIAAQVGYRNASKFSSAFREEMGKTPAAYRKTHGVLEH